MIFYTSDSHFGHSKIIGYCKRPFADIREMDETLIRNWNEAVQPEDDVYHLGDFCWGDERIAANYARRLNGRIHLVFGNHDRDDVRQSEAWTSAGPAMEIMDGKDKVCLYHYPCRAWNRSHHGSYGLFGHMHGAFEPMNRSADVGVDVFDFRPVTLAQIKAYLGQRKLDQNPKPIHKG